MKKGKKYKSIAEVPMGEIFIGKDDDIYIRCRAHLDPHSHAIDGFLIIATNDPMDYSIHAGYFYHDKNNPEVIGQPCWEALPDDFARKP